MASQQVLFAETITAMKKARKRKAYDSDSDHEIAHRGNRGQKLKKRARFIVNHAGYQRAIISRNPPLVDDEGYELDSDDDEQRIQDIMDSVADSDPYATLRLENILAPLTAVTDLPSHPTLSRPYITKTLTDLAHQGCDLMHKENAALWKVKHLQTKLNGDHIWAPGGLMLGPNDLDLYGSDYSPNRSSARSKVSDTSDESIRLLENARTGGSTNGQVSANGVAHTKRLQDATRPEGIPDSSDVPVADADADAGHAKPNEAGAAPSSIKGANERSRPDRDMAVQDKSSDEEKGASKTASSKPLDETAGNGTKPVTNGSDHAAEHEGEMSNLRSVRKKLNRDDGALVAVGPPSTVSDPVDDLYIHPIFLAPRSAHPDRDLGLPEGEAEDLRRLLQLFVQKQEEVCRGSKRLYEGLLRADRLRKTVFQWSKYEAHAGPNRDLSDGEDWYDKDEWGLDEDLKKGQDEEEEDTTQPTKKTRARR